MKYLLMTLAVVMIFAVPALAADQGNLSQANLAKMGLSGMAVMSDSQGTAVRGMGYSSHSPKVSGVSVAWGNSYANISKSDPASAGTVNGYFAIDPDTGHGGSLAGGANISVAGFAGSGPHNSVQWAVVGAAGASIAFTK